MLRWWIVLKCIHIVELVTFLSGLTASVPPPPPCVFSSAGDDGEEELKSLIAHTVCVCVCAALYVFSYIVSVCMFTFVLV